MFRPEYDSLAKMFAPGRAPPINKQRGLRYSRVRASPVAPSIMVRYGRTTTILAGSARTHTPTSKSIRHAISTTTNLRPPAFFRPAPRVTDRHGEATHKTRPYTARARDVLRTPLSHALFYVRPSFSICRRPLGPCGVVTGRCTHDALSGALAPRYPLSTPSHTLTSVLDRDFDTMLFVY
jgi:hypothetical protein